MALNTGMELRVKGVPISKPVRFTIDVGHAEKTIGLHFDFRFDYLGEVRTIVLNSRDKGNWGEEQREKSFPFEAGKEFQMTISFTADTFYINLHNGKMIEFPNRLGDAQYKYLSMGGDVMVSSLIVT